MLNERIDSGARAPLGPIALPKGVRPTDWHSIFHKAWSAKVPNCPICGIPKTALANQLKRLHRLAGPDDEPGVKWFARCRGQFVHRIDGRGKRIFDAEPAEPVRTRLRQAANLLAFGASQANIARQLGIDPDTLGKSIRKYPAFCSREIERARSEGPAALQSPIARETKDAAPAWIVDKMPKAAAAIAAGKTVLQAAAELGLAATTMQTWHEAYPRLWQEHLDRAMEIATRIVREFAGSEAVLNNPGAYLAQARACERWTRGRDEPLFVNAENTLSSFFETYFLPICCGELTKCSLRHYKNAVRLWTLFTGDPALKDVTSVTLARFKQCLENCRGKEPGSTMSGTTIANRLQSIQSILDKAGPRGRHNRDAAGIIPEAPWIKRPSFDVPEATIVPPEVLEAVYLAATCMEVPRIDGIEPAEFWRALIAVTFNTGLRRRTLFEMRMDEVEWDLARLALPPRRLKSRKRMIVPLNAVALEHLRRIQTDRELVFPWPYKNLSMFDRHFHDLQFAAGLSHDKHFGLHAIRKTHGSLLWEQSPQAAQFSLGHCRLEVTRAHYIAGGAIVARAVELLPQPTAFIRLQTAPEVAPISQEIIGFTAP
ncbi:MAG: tyrosine-type recombinase/integrase [Thermoguttaceae bacterium]